MLRIAILRGARAFRPPVSKPAFLPRTIQRFKSTGLTPEQQEAVNDLKRDWDAKLLSYEELLPKIRSPSPDSYLIDVREPEEVMQGMIPSAVNVPLSVLANSLHLTPEAFKSKHGFEKPGKSQELTFYCRSGKRSASAADVAKRNGFTNIYNYVGSWLEWVEKGGDKATK
ncbi:Rhodanese-like protein [Mycena crocata]|nr:Rhodanese-like protein [Mycena crocata]